MIVHVGQDKTGHLWYSLVGRSPPNSWEEGMKLQVSDSGNNIEGAFQFDPNFELTTRNPIHNPWKIWAAFAHVQSGMESLPRLGLLVWRGQITDSVISSSSNRRCRLSATAKENWLLAACVCAAIKDWLQGKNVPMDFRILWLEESKINKEYDWRGAMRTQLQAFWHMFIAWVAIWDASLHYWGLRILDQGMPEEVLVFLWDKEENHSVKWIYSGLVLDASSWDCCKLQWEVLERGKLAVYVRWTGEATLNPGAVFLSLSVLGLKEEAKRIPRQIPRGIYRNGLCHGKREPNDKGEIENFAVFPLEDRGVFLRKVTNTSLVELLRIGCKRAYTRQLARQFFFTWTQDQRNDRTSALEEDWEPSSYVEDQHVFLEGTLPSLVQLPEVILIPHLPQRDELWKHWQNPMHYWEFWHLVSWAPLT